MRLRVAIVVKSHDFLSSLGAQRLLKEDEGITTVTKKPSSKAKLLLLERFELYTQGKHSNSLKTIGQDLH